MVFHDASTEVQACDSVANDTQRQKWVSQEMVELGVQTESRGDPKSVLVHSWLSLNHIYYGEVWFCLGVRPVASPGSHIFEDTSMSYWFGTHTHIHTPKACPRVTFPSQVALQLCLRYLGTSKGAASFSFAKTKGRPSGLRRSQG